VGINEIRIIFVEIAVFNPLMFLLFQDDDYMGDAGDFDMDGMMGDEF
jgi:hypothetical protein